MTDQPTNRTPYSAASALALAQELKNQLIEWRRDFHRHPELAFGEFRTASIIVNGLAALGYELRVGSEVMDSRAIHYVDTELVNDSHAHALATGGDSAVMARMDGGMTGVVADLQMGAGHTVGFRIDMDALPITESS